MRWTIFLFLLTLNLSLPAQKINLQTYGKLGENNLIKRVITDIRNNYSAKKKPVVLYIPAGVYLLNEPIELDKYISIEGESIGSTILQVKNSNMEAIILQDNKDETDIQSGYNYIKNLTITGPEYQKNPFEWKNTATKNTRSVGIKVLGLRNRIENCIIDGFLWSGIQISASYYNFITGSFIKNNRVGIIVENTSTSTYINNNELRTNGAAILIQGNSYANFINNNMIENNIANYLDPAKNDNDANLPTSGSGIIISNATNNIIQNNYFEQHFTNLVLSNASENEISSNFFGVTNVNNKNQNILKFIGKSEKNTIKLNQTMGSGPLIDNARVIISDNGDFSSNNIDFGPTKNEKIKSTLRNNRNPKSMPQIP